MQEFVYKRRVRGVLYSPITIIILCAFIIIVARGTWNLYQKSSEASAGRERVEREIADIKAREGFLRQELAALNSSSGLEERLRQKFNVKREGEEVAVIIKPEEKIENRTETAKQTWLHGLIVRIVDFFQ